MKNHRIVLPALLALLSAGCASTPPSPVLEQTNSDYARAQRDPQVASLAAAELVQAGNAVVKANEAAKKDPKKAGHFAYLAQQQVAIAVETAKQRATEKQIPALAAQRDKLMAGGRVAEAQVAYERAELARRQLQESKPPLAQAPPARVVATPLRQKSQSLEGQLADLNPRQSARGTVITLSDIAFDIGRSDLKPESRGSIKKIAGTLKQYPERKIRIEGFTDNVGEAKYNRYLSEQRAEAVRMVLFEAGVGNDRMTTRGYGEDHPVASNATEESRQQNRRVEIVVSNGSDSVAAR